MGKILTREEAWELFTKYNKTESLQKHGLTVEAIMEYFARLEGEDETRWGIVGLLHDLDYEMYPQMHCTKAIEIMRAEEIDESYIHAVVSHGYGLCSDVEPTHRMEKILYTVDELSGLITAACLMRPSKSVLDIEVKSVKKKFKTKSFGAGVNREVIEKGCEMIGMSLDEVIEKCIEAMREKAEVIGLKGNFIE